MGFSKAVFSVVARDRPEEGRACSRRGLHLLLSAASAAEVCETPDFVPGLEVFVAALADAPLPPRTQAMLMRHDETQGAFASHHNARLKPMTVTTQRSGTRSWPGSSRSSRILGCGSAALSSLCALWFNGALRGC